VVIYLPKDKKCVLVDEELHKKLRIKAAKEDKDIQDIVSETLEEALEDEDEG
jgi:hypothetical protein